VSVVRAVIIASLFVACAPLGQRAVMSVDEYAEYRRFRVASSVEAKLGASYEYLRHNPRGHYRDEVSVWFSHEEPTYVDRSWNKPAYLRAFLAQVPAGPESERASRRLTELEMTSAYRATQEGAFDESVTKMEEKLRMAETGRRALVADTVRWVRRIAAIRSWGGRTSELDHEFIYAYRLSAPFARCTDSACTKVVTVAYAVPEAGTQSPREAVYEVGLRLERGGVAAAWITGPELFTRLGEAVGVGSVAAGDFVARAEAIGQATSLVALAVEPFLPAQRCTAESVSPVVLRRICDGIELRVVVATELGEEDRIVVEPSPRDGRAP
jgi:hypothetical protein